MGRQSDCTVPSTSDLVPHYRCTPRMLRTINLWPCCRYDKASTDLQGLCIQDWRTILIPPLSFNPESLHSCSPFVTSPTKSTIFIILFNKLHPYISFAESFIAWQIVTQVLNISKGVSLQEKLMTRHTAHGPKPHSQSTTIATTPPSQTG